MTSRYVHFSNWDIEKVLEQAITSTETMNSLDVDPDVIKARLKVIREIADGFNVDVEVPSNRSIMFARYMSTISA